MTRFAVGAGPAPSPFDLLARSYDETFTRSAIGLTMRRAVWRHLDRAFEPGEQVLELGCGTGEDAVHLAARGVKVLATDASPAMVDAARRKVTELRLSRRVRVKPLRIEELGSLRASPVFDGAFSNFGAMNCVPHLAPVAEALAHRLRPGSPVLLCFMGRYVPWEWAWFLLQGEPQKAFRRLSPNGVSWRGLSIRYPGLGAIREAFEGPFAFRRAYAIGALVPPSYAESLMSRAPRLLALLDRLERSLETRFPLPYLSDHVLVSLERR